MDTVMIIAEARNDFERMKSWFDKRHVEIKGIRALGEAPEALDGKEPLKSVLMFTRGDFDGMFRIYEKLRTNEFYKATSLVIIADFGTQAALSRNVRLDNTQVVGISITDENVQKIIDTALGIKPKPEPKKDEDE